MNILLTGGLGFIGSHCALDLIKNNHSPIVIDNCSTSKEITLSRLEKISQNEISFHKVDLTNLHDIDKVFKSYDIHSVIHLAGYKSVTESMLDPIKYYNNNITGSINLLKTMKKYSVKKILFSSSATVYGNPNYLPIDESHNLKPVNVYGETKLITERIIEKIVNSEKNWSAISLRYFNPIGSYNRGLLGEDAKLISDNLVPQILEKISNEESILRIYGCNFDTDDGSAIRDYIHISDLVEGHILGIKYLDMNNGFNTFNLGSGKGTSVIEVLDMFKKISKKEIPYIISKPRDGEIPEYFCDASKAFNQLKWKAKRNLEEMCSDAFLWNKRLKMLN
tara:strand:- start:2695 stop:3702 length:1008 start_codon:yes stop_codon:yes gene_type:complete